MTVAHHRVADWDVPLPLTVVGLACGSLLISAAFAGGRSHDGWAIFAFWLGWVLSFLVLAAAVTSPGLSTGTRALLVCLQAIQQSFVRWMYSPLSFTFPDELQHWRTAVDITTFHHLFHVNPTLPVSPVFPGLELMTTALSSLTHAGIFPAGLVIATISHVGLSAAVFILFRQVVPDDRIAGVAAFLFALNPLHAGFDTMFVYEAPALLFGAVGLGIALDHRKLSVAELSVGVIALGAMVVTHHLTAAFVLGALGVVGIVLAVLTRGGRTSRRTIALFLVSLAMASAWVATEARPVIGYLGGPLQTAVSGILHFGGQAGTVALPATSKGTPGAWLTILATIITAVLVIVGVVIAWRRPRSTSVDPWTRTFALGALGYFAVLLIRQFAPDGAEYAGRLLTFAAFFSAVISSLALMFWIGRAARWRTHVRAIALVAMLGIFLGSMTSGWPAPWELLPGRFHAAGFESGIDRQNMTAARWFAAHIRPNQRVACDFSMCTLLGAYAQADPIADAGGIYYAPRMNRYVLTTIHRRAIAYLVVDDRMSAENPITGHFFHVDLSQSGQQSRRIPHAALMKFRDAPGSHLIYDSGPIQIYDLRDLPYE